MQSQTDLAVQLNRIEFKLDAIVNFFRIPLEPRSILLQACEARSPSGKLVKLKAGQQIQKIQSISPELGWANVVINDEMLSVPLAFVDVHGKKSQYYYQLYALENNPALLNALYQQQNMPNQPAFGRQYFESNQILQSYQPTQIPQNLGVQQTKQEYRTQLMNSYGGSTFQPQSTAVQSQFTEFGQPSPQQQAQPFQQVIYQQSQHQQPFQVFQQPPQQFYPQSQADFQALQDFQRLQQAGYVPQYSMQLPQQAAQKPLQVAFYYPSNQLVLSENAEASEPLDQHAAEIQRQLSQKAAPKRSTSAQRSASNPTTVEPARMKLTRTDVNPPSEREVTIDAKHLSWFKPGAKSGSSLKLAEVVDVRVVSGELVIRATKGREMRLKGPDADLRQLAARLLEK